MADCLELNAREESQEKGREIIRQIDGWLMDASPKSRQKLRELFLDEGFLFRHDADTTIGYLRVLMQIYEQERSAGEEPTVLDLGRSHQELIDKLTELKFLLWRIAFAKDRQAEQELLSLIKGGRVSPYLMKQVVRIAAADKKEALLLLAGLCLEVPAYVPFAGRADPPLPWGGRGFVPGGGILREHWQSKAGRGLSGEGGQAGRADGKGAKTVWMRKRYVLSCA